jgi:hypothetical protein
LELLKTSTAAATSLSERSPPSSASIAFQAFSQQAGESDVDFDCELSWKDAARVSTDAASPARTVVLDTWPWQERFDLTFLLLTLTMFLVGLHWGMLTVDAEVF